NPEPHQYTNHRKIKENYPPKSAVPEKKVDELKSERETDALHKLEEMSQAPRREECFHPECPQYCAHLDKVAAEFKQRSGELDVMDHVAPFVSNPFRPLDVKQMKVSLCLQQEMDQLTLQYKSSVMTMKL
ncbi:unnamed protein product, partial [Gadus morhua 'NCC']